MKTAALNMKGMGGGGLFLQIHEDFGQMPNLEGRKENCGLFLIKEIIE